MSPPAGPAVSQLFPIVATRDMEATLAFYRDLLGGTVAYDFSGPDGVVVYAGLDLGSSHVGIGVTPDLPAASARARSACGCTSATAMPRSITAARRCHGDRGAG